MQRGDMVSNERMRFGEESVRGNKRGRFIFDVDEFITSSDDSLEAVDEAIALNDDNEAKMLELMRYDGNVKRGGSHGRKRRSYQAKSVSARRGRPLIGAEVRVKLHTSIANCTKKMLMQCGVTLATVLAVSARRLMVHG